MSDAPRASARLSQRFAELALGPAEGMTLGALLERLSERGHALLALVLVIPFLQPIPLPMLSTAFGLVVTLVGAQMALDRPPWVPGRLARRPLSAELIGRIAQAGQKLFLRFEHLVRPRIRFFHAHPSMRRLAGATIAISGLLLSLPLPVPASNLMPALAIALLAMGSLEEDGLVVLLGFVAFSVTALFFAVLGALPFGLHEALAHH
jgi:hypothetical protein